MTVPAEKVQVVSAPRAPANLVQADFCPDAMDTVNCPPTGAHGTLAIDRVTGHAGFDCTECHYVGGRLAFKPAAKGGLAFLPGYTSATAPSFNATTKTCSNIACHSVPAGEYSYVFAGEDKVAYYGSTGTQETPNWYSQGASCSACHGAPPLIPVGKPGWDVNYGTYVWHSGTHGGGNGCSLCHGDAVGTVSAPPPPGVSTGTALYNGMCNATTGRPSPTGTVPCAKYHANGTVNVTPAFRSSCFGCHS